MFSPPRTPSRLVPGAWPTKSSPKTHQGHPTISDSMRTNWRTLDQNYSGSSAHIFQNSLSKFDNTTTSVACIGLESKIQTMNTSFSSAYTSSPDTSSLPYIFEFADSNSTSHKSSRVRNLFSVDCSVRESTDSPDQLLFSPPTTPDLSSMVSLEEQAQATHLIQKCHMTTQVCRGESFFETFTMPMRHSGPDTTSSTCMKLLPGIESNSNKPLRLPQPDGRNSWTLFLSPTSIFCDDPDSSEKDTLSTCCPSNFPAVGLKAVATNATLPAFTSNNEIHEYQNEHHQQETSTMNYANGVLDTIFGTQDISEKLELDGSEFPYHHGLSLPMSGISSDNAFNSQTRTRQKLKIQHILRKLRHKIKHVLFDLSTRVDPKRQASFRDNSKSTVVEKAQHCRFPRSELPYTSEDSINTARPGPPVIQFLQHSYNKAHNSSHGNNSMTMAGKGGIDSISCQAKVPDGTKSTSTGHRSILTGLTFRSE